MAQQEGRLRVRNSSAAALRAEYDASNFVDITSTSAGVLSVAQSGTTPSITGSRGGNAALASLLTALDAMGIIEDNTTA